jgi:DNA oxidative demethylase
MVPGAVHLPGWLDIAGQRRLVAACRAWGDEAGGLRAPRMPRGGVMSVKITCLGWHWRPYRYTSTVEDGDGRPVAPFPVWLGALSRRALSDAAKIDVVVLGVDPEAGAPAGRAVERGRAIQSIADYSPDVALINWYDPAAKMGMHVDRDEQSEAPVVSLSMGDSCLFRFGSVDTRGRPWHEVVLESGDLVVFGGPARRAYHGVPKVLAGSGPSDVGVAGGRFNVTVRQSGLSGQV